MAIGGTPKYRVQIALNDLALTKEQFFVVAVEAAKKVGWNPSYLSNTGIIAYTNNGMLAWNAEIRIIIEDDIATIISASLGSEMIDRGKNKENVEAFLEAFGELLPVLMQEGTESKYKELQASFVPDDRDVLQLPPLTARDHARDFLSVFKPTQDYFVTPILLVVNIAVFILMAATGVNIISPDSEVMIQWGANFRPLTLEGQWWRLLTACFLHFGIIHLLANMYALGFIGMMLEPMIDKTRFAAAYILAGIAASVTSLWWHTDMSVSAGASGAIFGMYGVFLAMLTTDLIPKSLRSTLLANIGIFVAFNLTYGLKSGVDNAAHIGGLLSGMVIGYAYLPGLKKPGLPALRMGAIGLLAVAVLAGSAAVYTSLPNDTAKYRVNMDAFYDTQETAMEVYKLPADASKETRLAALRKGLDGWRKNLALTQELEKIDLPDALRERTAKMRTYCELRIKSYELIKKAIEEDSDQYNEQIDEYNKMIGAVLDELNAKDTKGE